MANSYKKLFEHAKIKNMSCATAWSCRPWARSRKITTGSRRPTRWNIPGRARGGVGMVLVEAQYVTNKTDPWIGYITTADTDEQMKGWAMIIEAIHAEGAKACLQLGCGLGRNAFRSPMTRWYRPVKCRRSTSRTGCAGPSPWTKSTKLWRRLAGQAARAMVAEADCVEIHAHSGYILDQFMTPAWNKRTDEYGGSFENRMRIVKEIYEAMRAAVGPDTPILMRMAATHDFEGGRTLEESIQIVNYMKELGVDAFDIDVGCYEHKQWICPSIYSGTSCMADYAGRH